MIATTTFDGQFGTLWVGALLLGSLVVLGTRRHALYGRLPAAAVVGGALVVRLVPAVVLNAGFPGDIQAYALIGRLVRAGHDVYSGAALGHYPYLPGQLWFSALASQGAAVLRGAVPFVVLVKLVPTLADAGIAGTLMAGLRRRGYRRQAACWAGCAYALNPISVLVTAYHGQFHAVPVFCCTVAWWLCEERDGVATTRAAPLVGVGLALGAGILAKSWPALLVPAFLAAARRPRAVALVAAGLFAAPLLGTAAYAVAYHVPVERIATIALGYQSNAGWWGLGALTAWLHGRVHLLPAASMSLSVHLSQALVIVGAVALPLWRRTSVLAPTLVLVLLWFYVFSANFNPQYLMWIMPFSVLTASCERALGPAVAFLVLATAALVETYLGRGGIYSVVPGPAMFHPGWQAAFYAVYLGSAWWLLRQFARHRSADDDHSRRRRRRRALPERHGERVPELRTGMDAGRAASHGAPRAHCHPGQLLAGAGQRAGPAQRQPHRCRGLCPPSRVASSNRTARRSTSWTRPC
jgi:hypothetical protein